MRIVLRPLSFKRQMKAATWSFKDHQEPGNRRPSRTSLPLLPTAARQFSSLRKKRLLWLSCTTDSGRLVLRHSVWKAGFHAHSQVGVSSFRIDLGVIDPARPGEYIVGVECDGATYHSARSARDRDRLRQEVLEGLGWRLHRIWSTDWFRNPQRETDKLLAAIKSARDKGRHPTVDLTADEDILELETRTKVIEESTSVTESTVAGDDDPVEASGAIHYKECALTVPYRRDLLDLSVLEVSRLSLMVVEAEGPVHTDEVARRIREAFGLQKTGKRILTHVRSGLKSLSRTGSVVNSYEFWSLVGQDIQSIRNRRHAPLPLRRAAMIAPAEYQLAISLVVAEVVAISRQDLVSETARRFGFDRTGPDLKEAIERQVGELVAAGEVTAEEDLIRSSFTRAAL
jgi:very-short-patch-repair endonuclease